MSAPERPWTPGPWVWRTRSHAPDERIGLRRADEEREWFTHISIETRYEGPAYLESAVSYIDFDNEADARLIASAPMLYEALREVVEWIDGWDCSFTYDDDWGATAARIDAALRAARGEESGG